MRCDITVPISDNASFVWRSICASRSAILKGAIRQVGDGSTIKVWHDRWIPDKGIYRVETPMVMGNEDMKVCDLFVAGEIMWDREKILGLFMAKDANLILSIPLSNRVINDYWRWTYDRRGMYTVKSAHGVFRENVVQM